MQQLSKFLWLVLLLVASAGARASTEFTPFKPFQAHETAHFRIIYQDREAEEAARELGAIAEEVRETLLRSLGVAAPSRVDVLLLDNYDAANGSALGFPYNTMRLYLTKPDPPASGSSDISDSIGETWMRELFTHEYTHVLHLNRLTGWTKWWARIFRSTPLFLVYPGWFTEGLALHEETYHGSRGRGRSSALDMFLRAAILEHRFLPVGAWGNVNGWPRGGSRYLYGGWFMHWVQARYGVDAPRRILDACNRQVPWLDDVRFDWLVPRKRRGKELAWLERIRLGGLERGFQKATGTPLSTLVKQWKAELEARYRREAALLEAGGLSRSFQLTAVGGNTRSPAVSPDGRLIAYVSSGDGTLPGIDVVPLAGGPRRHVLTRGDIMGTLAWSPDGRSLVYGRYFDRDSPLSRVTSRTDLFRYDLERGRETRLTRGLRVHDPSFGPGGGWMVAVAGGAGRTRLVQVSLGGGMHRDVFVPDATYQIAGPAVSPDGKRVAMSVLVQQEPPGHARYAIGLVNIDGTDFRLLPPGGVDREPAWIDAHRLVFSSDRTGVFNLYVVDLRDGRVRGLTNMKYGAFQPAVVRGWPPGLVFRGYSSLGFDIHRLELDDAATAAIEGRGPGIHPPDLADAASEPPSGSIAAGLDPLPLAGEAVRPVRPVGPPQRRRCDVGSGGRRPGRGPHEVGHEGGAIQNEPGKAGAEVAGARESAADTVAPWATATPDAGLPATAIARPITPEEAGITPLPAWPSIQTRPYHPLLGLRLVRIRPFVGLDEGAKADGYPSGATVGAGVTFTEPTGRHSIYLEAQVGIRSARPSWLAVYSNASLGLPIDVFTDEIVYGAGSFEDTDGNAWLIWQRQRRAGLEVGFPLSRGHFGAQLVLGGVGSLLRQFSALDDQEVSVWAGQSYETLDLAWSAGHAWRNPAQGQFLTLSSSQGVITPTGARAGTVFFGRWDASMDYTARRWAWRGPIDLRLRAGYRSDSEVLAGGYEGTWSLPGLPYGNVRAPALAIGSLTVAQDLWRADLPIGMVPWLYVDRFDAVVSLGSAAGFDNGRGLVGSGHALSVGLRAHLFTLRNGLSFSPRISAGIDLITGQPSWWFSLDGWPGLYRGLLPVGMRLTAP